MFIIHTYILHTLFFSYMHRHTYVCMCRCTCNSHKFIFLCPVNADSMYESNMRTLFENTTQQRNSFIIFLTISNLTTTQSCTYNPTHVRTDVRKYPQTFTKTRSFWKHTHIYFVLKFIFYNPKENNNKERSKMKTYWR